MSSENMPLDGSAVALPGQAGVQPRSGVCDAERTADGLGDSALIARAQAGDCTAFEALVHRYDRNVLRLALSVLHSPEDARDVYQETFLKIYRNLHRFRLDCSFHTWLYRIVINACLDHLRRRHSRPEDQAPLSASALREEIPAGDFFDLQRDESADPERRLLGIEIGQRIDEALALLSPRERLIFELKHNHGLKLRAIGEALGTTEETVKNALFRATRKLRAQLGEFR